MKEVLEIIEKIYPIVSPKFKYTYWKYYLFLKVSNGLDKMEEKEINIKNIVNQMLLRKYIKKLNEELKTNLSLNSKISLNDSNKIINELKNLKNEINKLVEIYNRRKDIIESLIKNER
mgnify:CR=1 FL=1